MKPRKHHVVFIIMVLISGYIGLQMMIYLLHALLGFNLSWGILEYCIAIYSEITAIHSIINIGLFMLIAYSFGMLIYVFITQILLEKKWNSLVHMNQHKEWTIYISRKFSYLNQRIIVINYPTILAVTSGFLRPRIILSSSLVSEFTESEVKAIVLHEYSHCLNYDPIRMLLVKMMTDSLPYIPILRRLSHYINVWVELDADSYAVQYLRSPLELASVLLKCSKMGRHIQVGIGFADEAINYRLLRLIEPKKNIYVPLVHVNLLAISSLVTFSISIIVISGCS